MEAEPAAGLAALGVSGCPSLPTAPQPPWCCARQHRPALSTTSNLPFPFPKAVKQQQPCFTGGDARNSILRGPTCRGKGASNLQDGARHGSPASSRAILPGYRGGKHSVPSRFFAVRERRHKSSPPSSHRTILAAYLPPTPRNSPDLLHLCWGGESNGGCARERGAPRVLGLCQAEEKAGMRGRARGRDGKGPRLGQTAAPQGAFCRALL